MEAMSCSCLQLQVPATAKRVWRGLGLSARLGFGLCRRPRRAGGLRRLRKEVRTCEYDDVHVMWDMLSNKPDKGAAATRRARTTTGRKPVAGGVAAAWSRLAFYCCGL